MYLTNLSRRIDRSNRADPLVRATGLAKRRYQSVVSSGYGTGNVGRIRYDRYSPFNVFNETGASLDVDALLSRTHLGEKLSVFGKRTRHSIEAAGRSRQHPADRRGPTELST